MTSNSSRAFSIPSGPLSTEDTAVPLGLYIHIPFCRSKCGYCDFISYAGLEGLIPEYVAALCHEMELRSEDRPRLSTGYFGGGTPSLLASGQIARILDTCRSLFSLDPDAEVSLETNPGTVTGPWLEAVRQAGVNRLSIGFQSLDDAELRFLGRIHSADEAVHAYQVARRAGFRNVNIDLIYGLPCQSPARWRDTLGRALQLSPEHLSLYPLTLEADTPLGRAVDDGAIVAPDPDVAADMYGIAEEVLASAGYEHYELSNWARPGYACRHNLTYWRNRPYLGVGAAAHSSLGGYRLANVSSPQEYIASLRDDRLPISVKEPIDDATHLSETVILGLRLAEGVDIAALGKQFGRDVTATYRAEIDQMEQLGLLECHGDDLRLTARGRLLGNEVFCRFLPKSA